MKMIEQYERIRRTGFVNMYDYNGVVHAARTSEFEELAEILLEDYKTLLLNFQELMKHYDIKQSKINTVSLGEK